MSCDGEWILKTKGLKELGSRHNGLFRRLNRVSREPGANGVHEREADEDGDGDGEDSEERKLVDRDSSLWMRGPSSSCWGDEELSLHVYI